MEDKEVSDENEKKNNNLCLYLQITGRNPEMELHTRLPVGSKLTGIKNQLDAIQCMYEQKHITWKQIPIT